MPGSDIQHDCHAEVLISLSSEWRQPERNQANYKTNQPNKNSRRNQKTMEPVQVREFYENATCCDADIFYESLIGPGAPLGTGELGFSGQR